MIYGIREREGSRRGRGVRCEVVEKGVQSLIEKEGRIREGRWRSEGKRSSVPRYYHIIIVIVGGGGRWGSLRAG